jgi:hypothetical protein
VDGEQTVDLAGAVTSLRACVDALLSVHLTAETSEALIAAMVELETQRRRLEAVDARMLAPARSRPGRSRRRRWP